MLTFPTALFAPGSLRKRLVSATISGGQSLSGITQTARTDGGGFWMFEFSNVVLNARSKFKTFEAVALQATGGATQFVVPLCDRRSGPFADPRRPDGVGFGDDSTFSDGALWGGELVTASIDGSAALRTTRMRINTSHTVTGGEPFTGWHGLVGQRMYQITQVHDQGDGWADISFMPPLRQATPDGFPLDFDNPRCTMTAVGDLGATLDMLRFGLASIQFAESFGPVYD